MSAPATAFLAYLWHYMLARLIYDELVRPLAQGRVSTALLVVVAVVAGSVATRASRRRR
jgi:hypothetical protein